MTAIPQPNPGLAVVRWAFRHLRRLRDNRVRSIVIGEVCFVGGWSLMWATALGVVPQVPTVLWLSMIVFGLVLASGLRSRRSRRAGGQLHVSGGKKDISARDPVYPDFPPPVYAQSDGGRTVDSAGGFTLVEP